MKVKHNIKPIYNKNSKVLILGSMPSIISRKNNFYYANPANRFWQVIETVFNIKLNNNDEKTAFLLKNKIALWDVIGSCDIDSSSDSSIKNVEVNNIYKLLAESQIKYIFCTGKTSFNIFKKHFKTDIPVIYLSSTSGANAQKSLLDLINEYKNIKEVLD